MHRTKMRQLFRAELVVAIADILAVDMRQKCCEYAKAGVSWLRHNCASLF